MKCFTNCTNTEVFGDQFSLQYVSSGDSEPNAGNTEKSQENTGEYIVSSIRDKYSVLHCDGE